MDLVITVYYALICGLLGVAAPHVPTWPGRLVVGMVVGLVAAQIAPIVRGLVAGG